MFTSGQLQRVTLIRFTLVKGNKTNHQVVLVQRRKMNHVGKGKKSGKQITIIE